MFLGRQTNQWIGAFTAVFGAVVVVLAALTPPIIIPSVVVGAVTVAFGAIILLVAGQPPTVNAGSTVTVVNPGAQPNASVVMDGTVSAAIAGPPNPPFVAPSVPPKA